MPQPHAVWLRYAVAASMRVDALGCPCGPIRRALNSGEPYWQKRLLLNLMPASRGLYPGAALTLVGAVIATRRREAAFALFGPTLASCIYTLLTIPPFTPRNTAQVIPRALAAALIVIGFIVTRSALFRKGPFP